MLNVIFYNFHLAYRKLPKDVSPEVSACLALGACESFLLAGVLQICSLKYFCFDIDFRVFFILAVLLCAVNYWYYIIKENGEEVIDAKPSYFNSQRLSAFISLLFFLITVSWMFWGPIYSKHLIENCREGVEDHASILNVSVNVFDQLICLF